MKKLLYQGIFWRGLNYLTVFAVTIAIAKLFKARDSGVINYLVNNLAFLILLTSLSLESATGFYSAKNEISQPALAGISIVMTVLSVVVNAVMISLVIEANDPWMLAVLYCGGVVLINYFMGLFNSHYDYIFPNAVVVFVNCLIVLVAILIPAALRENGGELFLQIYFGSFLFTGVVLSLRYIYVHSKSISLPSRPAITKLMRYALMATLANVVFFLVYRVDYWFVNKNCTDQELGNYIQVSKLGQIFMLLPGIIGAMVFTRTARSASVDQLSTGVDQLTTGVDQLNDLQLLSRLLFLGYVVVLLLLAVFGFWIFPGVYGDTFDLMYLPFILLIPGVLSLATLALITAYNAGQGRILVNLAGSVIALIVIVAGNLIFSKRYGIHAAAAVSSAGYICNQVYVMWKLRVQHPQLRFIDFFGPRYNDLVFLRNLWGKDVKQAP